MMNNQRRREEQGVGRKDGESDSTALRDWWIFLVKALSIFFAPLQSSWKAFKGCIFLFVALICSTEKTRKREGKLKNICISNL